MARRDDYSRTVYSTESGRICPKCGRPVSGCTCKTHKKQTGGDGIVRVRHESKGRGGKVVTTISGVPLDEAGLKDLATALKKLCGTGGTVKDGIIEIQGAHADQLVEELKSRGFTTRRAGG